MSTQTDDKQKERIIKFTKQFNCDDIRLDKYYVYNDRVFLITRKNMNEIYVQASIFKVEIRIDYKHNKYIVKTSIDYIKYDDIKDSVDKACDIIIGYILKRQKGDDLRNNMNNFIEGLNDYKF